MGKSMSEAQVYLIKSAQEKAGAMTVLELPLPK
jgi:hypothetical protein